MHDAYIGGRSENNIKCVVHDDLGRKNRTTRYTVFCRVTDLTSDFLSFIVVEHIRFFHGALHIHATVLPRQADDPRMCTWLISSRLILTCAALLKLFCWSSTRSRHLTSKSARSAASCDRSLLSWATFARCSSRILFWKHFHKPYTSFRIKNSSKHNQLFLHCWRFGLYWRPRTITDRIQLVLNAAEEWWVVRASLIAACSNCFTPSYIGWTFLSVSSINSES